MILDAKKELFKPEASLVIGSLAVEDKKILAKILFKYKESLNLEAVDIEQLLLYSTASLPFEIINQMITGMINNMRTKIETAFPTYSKVLSKEDMKLIATLSFIPDWLKAMLNE